MGAAHDAFRLAIRDAGLHPPNAIVADGRLHRFSSDGRRGNLAGWYVLHDDDLPAGKFGDWRTNLSRAWRGDRGRRLTPQERAALARRLDDLRAARNREQARRHAQARARAADILAGALPAPDNHDYLVRRKIGAHGLRQFGGRLLVPVMQGTELVSLQFIGPNGAKRFLLDGMVKGCHFIIGEPADVICVAEGFATAASIREATGHAVAIAFNAGNLRAVAVALRQRFPALRLIVCADDDWKTPGNPGLTSAHAAAQAVDGWLCAPVFGTDRPDDATDFNDLHRLHGPSAVRDCLERAARTTSDVTKGTAMDPLDDLMRAIATDKAAAFTPEALQLLAATRATDPGRFEQAREAAIKAGVRAAALDRAIGQATGKTEARGPNQTDVLLQLMESVELFHAADGRGYADLDVDGHRETWAIDSRGFKDWLTCRYFERTGSAPGSEALQAARAAIEARARFAAPERVVHVRVAALPDRIFLDLCDSSWRAVEIDARGWRIVERPPVRFRRERGMRPLRVPLPGGSIDRLRAYLNVQSDADFVLVVAWALGCLRGRGPYPLLVIGGEQGSAKSTFAAILRALLDPNAAPLRALPRNDHELFIAAENGHLLAFDNVSGISPSISDTFCRLASGGGFSVRQLYTDREETLFEASRPIILNGIEDIVARHDLADRAMTLTLAPIGEERRRPEAGLWADFARELPHILGALLNAVSTGLQRLPTIQRARLPRMADFARWAMACETAMWPEGTYWSAHAGNREETVQSVISADPVAAAVQTLMSTRRQWQGTATELLHQLQDVAGERVARSKAWPGTPNTLSNRLRRAATFLRQVGIDVPPTSREGRARTRMITITAAGESGQNTGGDQGSSAPSAPSASSTAATGEPVGTNADHQTARANPLNAGMRTDADDGTDPGASPDASLQAAWTARL